MIEPLSMLRSESNSSTSAEYFLFLQDLEITNDILKETIDFLRSGVKMNLLDQLNTVTSPKALSTELINMAIPTGNSAGD